MKKLKVRSSQYYQKKENFNKWNKLISKVHKQIVKVKLIWVNRSHN
jgi:hypothetical protein